MNFIIYEQLLKAKTKEEIEKKDKNGNPKKMTLNKLLFEDRNGSRDSLVVFDNNLYMIMEERKNIRFNM